jgi:hypothetical protein
MAIDHPQTTARQGKPSPIHASSRSRLNYVEALSKSTLPPFFGAEAAGNAEWRSCQERISESDVRLS